MVTTYGIVYNRAGYLVFINLYPDLFGYGDGAGKAFFIAALYAMSAAILCFYPLAGYLADNKFGRFKTVIRSLYVLMGVLVIFNVLGAMVVPLYYLKHLNERLTVLRLLFANGAVSVFASTVSFVGVNANIIQFGMDQLHDSPGDHQSLFIHWFTWVYSLGIFIHQLGLSLTFYIYISDLLHYSSCSLLYCYLWLIWSFY